MNFRLGYFFVCATTVDDIDYWRLTQELVFFILLRWVSAAHRATQLLLTWQFPSLPVVTESHVNPIFSNINFQHNEESGGLKNGLT